MFHGIENCSLEAVQEQEAVLSGGGIQEQEQEMVLSCGGIQEQEQKVALSGGGI